MRRRVGSTHGTLLAAVAGALLLAAPAGAALHVRSVDSTDYPTIRVTVVAPTDSTPAPSLLENAADMPGSSAHRLQGKSVVLAIDRSRSMRGRPLARAIAAARTYVRTMPADDRIAVVSFGSSAAQLTTFSNSTIDADGALRGLAVDTRQGTALHDAVSLGSRALAGERNRPRVIVLLTDGRDVSSNATLAEALAVAKADRVAVYTIAIPGRQFTPGPLKTLAQDTGGAYYKATTARLGAVYKRIGDELRRTWVVEYPTAARPGDRLRLTVYAPRAGAVTASYVVPETAGGQAKSTKSGGGWRGPVILGLIVGLLVFGGVRLAHSLRKRARMREALEPYVESADESTGEVASPAGTFAPARWHGFLAPLFATTERLFGHTRFWASLEQKLVRANLSLRTAELVWVMFTCGLVPTLIAIAAGLAVPFALLFFVVGAAIPYFVVRVKADRRARAFDDQLPDALNTLAGTLQVGHSFTQGVQALVESADAPISEEFGRVLTELRLGARLDTALLDMGARIGSRDLDFVIRAVIVQRTVGGGLAALFELIADTVDKRHKFKLRVKALTAMGRMSATVLICLPFGVALLVSAVNPGYMAPLFRTTVGQVLLAVGLTMIVIGSLILRRMVAIKV